MKQDKYMYIDIHSHILPELDDGAQGMAQAREMLKIAYENHISVIIATPHNKANRHNPSRNTIECRAADLQRYADESSYNIQIYTGTEFFYRSELAELLNQQEVCTMAGTSYVLVEFSPLDNYAYIRDGLYNLLAAGYRPIIAHIERYQCVMKDQRLVDELIDMGCFAQVNAGSILGKFGFHTKSDTKKLLKNGRVHFIASDAHNDKERAPELELCARKLYRIYAKAYIDDLLFQNAKKLIANEYI